MTLTPYDGGCPFCDGTEPFPHTHHLATILNSRIYCPDGRKHEWVPRRLRRPRCELCGEVEPR